MICQLLQAGERTASGSQHRTGTMGRKRHWADKQQNVMSMCRKDDKVNGQNAKLAGAGTDWL